MTIKIKITSSIDGYEETIEISESMEHKINLLNRFCIEEGEYNTLGELLEIFIDEGASSVMQQIRGL